MNSRAIRMDIDRSRLRFKTTPAPDMSAGNPSETPEDVDHPLETEASAGAATAASGAGLRALPLLFAAGGCASLIYEVAWLQLLQLVIGSTAVSMAVLLGTFMGGLGLGGILLPRLIPIRHHPLRVYAALELGTGVCGLIVLLGLPALDRLYAGWAGAIGGLSARAAVAVAALLPPTILMGATLPAVSRWLGSSRSGAAGVGFLYGANTLGAVLGSLIAAFYLLRVHDTMTATAAAAGLNFAAAGFAFAWARRHSYEPAAGIRPAGPRDASPGLGPVFVAIALSGLTALGAEVVWTRLLSLTMGGTVYVFALILAVFLGGLAAGSAAGAALARRTARPLHALGWMQAALAAAIVWTAFAAARIIPAWPNEAGLAGKVWLSFGFDLVRGVAAILPPTLLWGASFPLALAAAARPGRDMGRVTGGIAAANTIGAIAGAAGFSLLALPSLGTQGAQRLLVILTAVSALVALSRARSGRPRARAFAPVPAAAVVLMAAAACALLPQVSWRTVAYGRLFSAFAEEGRPLYVGEGANASVAVTEVANGTRVFHVSGRIEASSATQDMRLQRMLAHVPALVHPRPRSALVVGCGAGVTAGTLLLHPDIRRVVVCEIEPLIVRKVARLFAAENSALLDDPRVEIVIDDARHYVLRSRERFDIVTSDPVHPWIKGSAALYTREYFEACRRLLAPGGLVSQWVPLYESTPEAVRSEMATFFAAFPHGTVWSNEFLASGYDLVLLGGAGPARIDLDALQRRLERSDHAAVARSMAEVDFKSAVSLAAAFAARAPDLRGWLSGATINTDGNLRLQYLAGIGPGRQWGHFIYERILEAWSYPEDLFSASPELRRELRRVWNLE